MAFDGIKWYSRIPGYHYYDTPEGEDCLKKVFFMAKAGLLSGVMVGTLDIVTISKPVGIAAIAARYAKISYPLMAVASTFAATCCVSTHLRQKDDTYNYFYGGFSAGCVAGACARSGVFGTAAAVGFGIFGYLYKFMDEMGLEFFPSQKNLPQAWYGIWAIHWDYSLYEDFPRGWKKSEDEVLEVPKPVTGF